MGIVGDLRKSEEPTIRIILRSLIWDNPVLDYLTRRAARRYRRWGWALALLPLCAFGWLAFFDAMTAYDEMGGIAPISPASYAMAVSYVVLAILAGLVCVFSLGGVARLLRAEKVEPLFLTSLSPAQIWMAALINMNRNQLVLAVFVLPAVGLMAFWGRIPVLPILVQWLILLALANLWTLTFYALAVHRGFRFAPFVSAGLVGVYLIGATSFWMAATFVHRSSHVPFIDVGLPPVAWFLDSDRLMMFPIVGAPSPKGVSFSIMGKGAPYALGWPVAAALWAACCVGTLLVGPLQPFRERRDEEGARRGKMRVGEGLGASLWRWAGNPLFLSSSGPRYAWAQIVGRLYENAPAPIRRNDLRWKCTATNLWWVLAVMGFVDSVESFFGRARGIEENQVVWIFVTLLGLLAGLHWAYAGAADTTDPARRIALRTRRRAYAFKIVFLLGALCIGDSGGGVSPMGWLAFTGATADVLGFVALIWASQAAVQIWISRRARHPSQALTLGVLHGVAIWIGPLLVLPFQGWAPAGVIRACSLSPALALMDLFRDVSWTVGRGMAARQFSVEWRYSGALLGVELAVFGGLVALGAFRRRVGR